jgi:hypothetical protein
MAEMPDQLNSKNLVPFKQRRNVYHLPGGIEEQEELLADQVDHDLSPEEQGYVRHYLGYADQFLKSAEESAHAAREKEAAPPKEDAAESAGARRVKPRVEAA